MSKLESKLKEMGYMLPAPFKFPRANRTGCVQVGSILFVSGHGRDLASWPGVKHAGKAGAQVSEAEGYATARAVALSIKQEIGDLDRLKRVVRLFGMVDAAPGFQRMPNVIDGASDFFFELLGPVNGKQINGEFEVHR